MTAVLSFSFIQKSVAVVAMVIAMLFGMFAFFAPALAAEPCDTDEFTRVNGVCLKVSVPTTVEAVGTVPPEDFFDAQTEDSENPNSSLLKQIQALLEIVAALQEQLSNQGSSADLPEDLDSTLEEIRETVGRGSSDDRSNGDVTRLQKCLMRLGHYDEDATGFFGPVTETAVKRFQASNGIVSWGGPETTGYGNVGPSTRKELNRVCRVPQDKDDDDSDERLTARPQSGSAPLIVSFFASHGDDSNYQPSFADGTDTMVDFGDGSPKKWVRCKTVGDDRNGGKCKTPEQFTHTYRKDGIYKAKLVRTGGFCPAPGCPVTILDTVTIKVGVDDNPISCPDYQEPQCGPGEVVVKGDVTSNGCYLAPKCEVKEVDRPIACPAYYPSCPAGQAVASGGNNDYGCPTYKCVWSDSDSNSGSSGTPDVPKSSIPTAWWFLDKSGSNSAGSDFVTGGDVRGASVTAWQLQLGSALEELQTTVTKIQSDLH